MEILLIYSLVYAAWVASRSRSGHAPKPVTTGPLHARHLVALGAGIAIATFVVRRWFPFDSLQFTNAHVWQWPECIGLFGLGVVSARRGWLRPVPERIRRGCGWVTLVATVALILAVLSENQERPGPSPSEAGEGRCVRRLIMRASQPCRTR